MCMNDQTGGLLNPIYGNYGLQRGLAAQQNVFNQSALSSGLGQQMGNCAGMQNDFRSPDQRRLDRAIVIAAEIRARRPEMQVRKLKQPQE